MYSSLRQEQQKRRARDPGRILIRFFDKTMTRLISPPKQYGREQRVGYPLPTSTAHDAISFSQKLANAISQSLQKNYYGGPQHSNENQIWRVTVVECIVHLSPSQQSSKAPASQEGDWGFSCSPFLYRLSQPNTKPIRLCYVYVYGSIEALQSTARPEIC